MNNIEALEIKIKFAAPYEQHHSAAARVFACDTSEPAPFTTKSQVRKYTAHCRGGTKIVTGSDCNRDFIIKLDSLFLKNA